MVVEIPNKKSLIAPLVTTAAALGTVQGFSWCLLSLGAIFFHEKIFLPTSGLNGTILGRTIFNNYLDKANDNATEDSSIIIGPKEFNYFMYFYIVLSFSLLIISTVILWASITGKSEKWHKLRISLWTVNMTLLSLLDFILVCLIGHDYGKVKSLQGTDVPDSVIEPTLLEAYNAVILVAIGIVMTLAARGFVVWIINVIFIVILGKHWYNLQKKGPQPDQSILDAYTTGSRPPWDLYANTNRSEYNNKGFRDDQDNPMIISSSQSFTHLPLQNRDNYGNRERENQKGRNPYNNYGGQNNNMNNNNWNKRNQNDNGPYGPSGDHNSPLRAYSQPDRLGDGPNQWNQPAPLRTAKIGRQGGQRSPPLNVNPPFIPDPDYSPPGSPRVRGVLRPKSNYAMY